jgi:hypothetical protein
MIFGRPTNLWTGLIGAADAMLITIIGATQSPDVAQQWAIILGAVGAFLGVAIAFLAGQPPTLNPGDTFNTVTPAGQPNYVTTVATPPASDPPPVPAGG